MPASGTSPPPVKVLAAARFTEPRARWWVEYGVRAQTDVTRITPTLLTRRSASPRICSHSTASPYTGSGWGANIERDRDRLGLTFAIENLTNAYYREHFQFAPSRGRSFTVGLNVGAF
jgi:outer membrane receptor protein involved in Fe transport